MSFRSKRTFVDVQQSVEQSSTLEYNIDKTHSPKLAKASVKVSNRWGPFSPSKLRPTNAPKSSTAPLPFHNLSYAPSKEILHDTTRPMIVKPRLSSMLQSSTIVAKSPQRGLQDQRIGPKPPRKAPQEFVHTSQVPQTTPILPLFHSPPSVIEVEHSPPLESVPTSTVSVHSPPNNNDGNRSSFEGEDLDQEKAGKGENDKAKTKVIETLACSSKSQVDIENSVFDELMYGGKSPKRPLNHGFGVKKSDIYGVQSSVGHGRRDHVNMSATKIANLEAKLKSVSEENETLSSKVDETNQTLS